MVLLWQKGKIILWIPRLLSALPQEEEPGGALGARRHGQQTRGAEDKHLQGLSMRICRTSRLGLSGGCSTNMRLHRGHIQTPSGRNLYYTKVEESTFTSNMHFQKRRVETCLPGRHIQRMWFVGTHIRVWFHKHDKLPAERHLNVYSRKTSVHGTASCFLCHLAWRVTSRQSIVNLPNWTSSLPVPSSATPCPDAALKNVIVVDDKSGDEELEEGRNDDGGGRGPFTIESHVETALKHILPLQPPRHNPWNLRNQYRRRERISCSGSAWVTSVHLVTSRQVVTTWQVWPIACLAKYSFLPIK